jgi:putative ABC transport system permease protein
VCGASVKNLAWRLSRGFALKLILALVIATPITYLAGSGFVQTFTRHIEMSPDLFLLGGILAMMMVIIASGWKIILAATSNPVNALRYE